jgi:WD40 repeat protein
MAEAFISRRGGSGMKINGQEIMDVVFGETINRGDRVVVYPPAQSLVEDLSTLPTDMAYGCAFSPDGTYLAVAHFDSPYITIYKRSGDTFTKLNNPSVLPTGVGLGCAFSPDGVYLAVAHDSSPFITIYKRSGDTFTKLGNPSSLPGNQGNGCAFSPDGTYLAVAHTNSPYITIYKRSGDTFTKLSNPPTLPTDWGLGCAFSPDGTYLAVAHYESPYITIYVAEYQANLYIDSSTYGLGSLLGYAVESGTSNETKKVAKLFKI